MCKIVLNIAAGTLPISGDDFCVPCKVLNFDPLSKLKDMGHDGYWLGIFFALIGNKGPNSDDTFEYGQDSVSFYAGIANGSVDLAMSISPYGFCAIDSNVDNALKVGGHVLIAGNSSNQWIEKKLFQNDEIKAKYGPLKGVAEEWISCMADKIRSSYPSLKSALGDATSLDKVFFYRKNVL